MEVITINLPEIYIKALNILVDMEIVSSRSEAIRIAIKKFIEKESLLSANMEEKTFEKIIRSGMRRNV